MSRERASRFTVGLAASGLLAATFILPPQKPLPFDLCLLHRLTGLPCLTCGLTRAVCLLARGEWRASLSMHPAGWPTRQVTRAQLLATELVSFEDRSFSVKEVLHVCAYARGGV